MTADSPADTDLAALAGRLLDAARRAGADAADAMVVESAALSIDVRDGGLEEAQRAEGLDLGLRVLVGRRQAIVSASDRSDATVAAMAERAVAMAREAPEDPHAGLAEPADLARDRDMGRLHPCDPSPEPDPAALEEDARRAEAAARAVGGVTRMDQASAGYSRRRVHLAATNGFSASYVRTERGLSCVAIAGEGTGMERDWDYDSRVFQADLRSPEEIGRIAGERAVARLGAVKPQTGTYPVLYDERVAGSLMGHLLSAVNGAMVARGSSFLRDALGTEVLPRGLSLTEEPHRHRIGASRLFDAEGLPTARRDIVADGVLTGWVLDLATGRKLGLPSTGNAARGPASLPSPSVTNIRLTPGSRDLAALMAEMGTGLYVTQMIGATINPNTGDYSRGASGFWVEGGRIVHPVNECTIAGNLRDMLLRIVPGRDGREERSHVVPSILIADMVIAGK
jgi:PmbA protein